MATEPTKPVQSAQPPFVFNRNLLQAHLEKVVDSQDKYKGMKNHNPFMFIDRKVKPLIRRLNGYQITDGPESGRNIAPETTESLHTAILALPLDHVPVVNPNYKSPEKPNPAKTSLGPTGQHVVNQ